MTMATISAACGEHPSPEVELTERPYWEPALNVATRALDVMRSLELNTRELATKSQSPKQFVSAIEMQFESISALSQELIPLTPPASAIEAHKHLTSAADALVEVMPNVRAYNTLEKAEHLVHILTLAQNARMAMLEFAAAIGDGEASSGLRKIIDGLGEIQLDIRRVPVRAVLIGQFDGEAEARARIGTRLPDIQMSVMYRRWVEAGRYSSFDEADAVAIRWQAEGFETRIEDVLDLSFDLTEIQPMAAGTWTERSWIARAEFDIMDLASSDGGDLIVAAARGGQISAFGPGGQPVWARNLGVPLARVTVAANGSLVAAHGFDLMLLDNDGAAVWRSPARPDNQLLEEVSFDYAANSIIARSTNASGIGHVFAFNKNGQIWGPTKAYIGAVGIAINPSTGTVAVASSKLGENQIVLISPDGNLEQRFGVEGELITVMITTDGAHTIGVTTTGLQIFDSSSGDSLWRVDYPTTTATRMPSNDTVVLAGSKGVGAFSVNGTQLWQVPGLVVERLLVTTDYVIVQTNERTFKVFRSDGAKLGHVIASSAVQAASAAREQNLLLAATVDRSVEAWQLPNVSRATG